MLIAERLGLDASLGNAVLSQEVLDARDAPLGQCLVVRYRPAWIGMAFQNQMRIWFALKIRLEVSGKRGERLLLAGQQACIGILDRGL